MLDRSGGDGIRLYSVVVVVAMVAIAFVKIFGGGDCIGGDGMC